LALAVEIASPQRRIPVIRLDPPEAGQRGNVLRIGSRVRAEQVARIFLEVLPRPEPTELEGAELDGIADAKFVLRAPYIGERSELVATVVEQLHGGERRPVLRVSGIAEAELDLRLRQENQIVILESSAGVAEMTDFRYRQVR